MVDGREYPHPPCPLPLKYRYANSETRIFDKNMYNRLVHWYKSYVALLAYLSAPSKCSLFPYKYYILTKQFKDCSWIVQDILQDQSNLSFPCHKLDCPLEKYIIVHIENT